MSDRDVYDTPWKAALERWFPEFLALLLPEAHSEIDWSQEVTFLENELRKLAPDAEAGDAFVDKLARVTLRDGERAHLYLHVDVQRAPQRRFARRMFRYSYRIFDRYDVDEVVSLAVLGDEDPDWRPSSFAYGRWGSRAGLTFPAKKLLDWEEEPYWSQLERSPNPFALVIMAHLKTLRTPRGSPQRLDWKLKLVRLLTQRGYTSKVVRELLVVLEWFLRLPPELDQRFRQETAVIEKKAKFPPRLKSRFERRAELEARRDSVVRVLEARFGDLPEPVTQRIGAIDDEQLLQSLITQAARAATLDEFRQLTDSPSRAAIEEETSSSWIVPYRVQVRRHDVVRFLEARFGDLPEHVVERIHAIEDDDLLQDLVIRAARDASLNEFCQAIPPTRE